MGYLDRLKEKAGENKPYEPPVVERKREVRDRLLGKMGKQDANYRPARAESKISCAECEHYLFPGNPSSNCRRIAGIVYAEDVCDLYTVREAEGGPSTKEA